MRFALFMIESPYRPHVGPTGRAHDASPSASLTDPEFLGGVARFAEEVGFGAMLFPEHVVLRAEYTSRYPYQAYEGGDFKRYPFDQTSFPEPLVALAYVAAVTRRMRLGTSVLILPQRNPVLLAKQIATLDALSRGRVSLAVGVGWFREEFEALGHGADFARRGRLADEYIGAMRALWTQPEASYHGEAVRFDRIRCLPKPAQRGGVPLIVGGHSEAAARRAGRLGDGYMPIAFAGHTGGDPLARLDTMRAAAREAGRDPDRLEVWTGAPPDAAAVRRLADHGVTQVHMPFTAADLPSAEQALERYANEVIAKV